jgi:hypothetical protein
VLAPVPIAVELTWPALTMAPSGDEVVATGHLVPRSEHGVVGAAVENGDAVVFGMLAAASLPALLILSPVHAESIPNEEKHQLDNSALPDVDPGASKGHDKTIVEQEKAQLNNSAQPSVKERAEKRGESIPNMEKEGLE